MARATRISSVGITSLQHILSALLAVICCLAVGSYITAHWVENQILNTDNWVALVTPLPKQPVVSEALGTYIGKHVFSLADVEDRITSVLPPRADILAPPIADQLESITISTSKKIVASDNFQTLWSGANRLAMNRLVSQARGEPTALQKSVNERFNLNLSGVNGQLRDKLGSAAAAIPALQPASQKALTLAVSLQAKRERLWQVVRGVDYSAAVLPMVAIATLCGALAFAQKRRRTVMRIAAGCIVVILLELISIKAGRERILGLVQDPANIPAISYIYDTIVALVRHSMFWALGVAAFIFLIATAFGPAKWAWSFRSIVRLDKLAATRIGKWWQNARSTVRRHQTVTYVVIVGLALAYMALVMELNSQSSVNVILLTLSLMAIVRIVATPRAMRATTSPKAS